MDNRLAWSICLCDDFIDIHVPSRAHIPFLLPVPIRFYFCIIDGECAVERDLGRLTAEDQEHGGKLGAPEFSDVMVINERGPRAHAERQVESDAGPLPTETTNEWVTEWRLVHGARVGCSPSAAASAAPRSKKVVFKTIVARVLAAGRSASRKEKSPAANNHGETCFGRRRSFFAASAQGSEEWRTSSLWTAKHDKFQDDTNKQMRESGAAMVKQQTHQKWLPNVAARRSAPLAPRLDAETRVYFVGQWEASERKLPASRIAEGADACRTAGLVAMSDLAALFEPPGGQADDNWLADLTAIYGDGLPVTTKREWQRAGGRPDQLNDIIFHKAARLQKDCIVVHDTFQHNYPRTFATMSRLSRSADGAWTVRVGKQPRAVSATFLASGDDARVWIESKRKVKNYFRATRVRVLQS